MTQEEFDAIVENRLERTRQTLIAKSDEYAREDRLSNFKKVASFTGCSPERALWGFVLKHIAALDDFINDLEEGKVQSPARWDEKITDIRAYMHLLDALLQERF